MRLPEIEAERILLKHWNHLQFASYFIQTALYISTPRLLEVAKAAINECSEPTKLFEHLHFHYGIMTKNHPGLTREVQVLSLAPYLHLISPMTIGDLWSTCNDHGWFATRRKILDNHLQSPYIEQQWDRDRAKAELDSFAENGRSYWMDHWIDNILKTDVSWEEILTTLKDWLNDRQTFEALEIVASAIELRGTRKDLAILKTFEGIPEIPAKQLITDTKFAVRRRSIS